MPVQIGAKPDSGFDNPLGMLIDCHRRIEQFLEILCLVADRAAGRALSGEESEAVRASLDYFRKGGQRHNADEEESLFPRLRAASNESALNEIDSLERDHRDSSLLHEAVEKLYAAWMEGGELALRQQKELLSMTQRLKRVYEEHIRLEEQVVFPRAAKVLNEGSIAEMGREFRARRQ
jgi:hemerythrin-like domain-containing protein